MYIERTTSGFPLSIGTGLAFESLFPIRTATIDATRVPPVSELDRQKALNAHSYLVVNLFTLARNIVASITPDQQASLSPTSFYETLEFEIVMIVDILRNEGGGKLTPLFIHTDGSDLKLDETRKLVTLRQPSSPRLEMVDKITTAAIKKLAKTTQYVTSGLVMNSLDNIIRKLGVILLTSNPLDLLERKHFVRLTLLESHTGKLKDYPDFYTKLYPVPNEDLSIIPFNRMSLYIFGDKHVIRPYPMQARQLMLKVAKERKWNANTSARQMLSDMENFAKDAVFCQLIKPLATRD